MNENPKDSHLLMFAVLVGIILFVFILFGLIEVLV